MTLGPGHHVIVGQDIPSGIDDDAGALTDLPHARLGSHAAEKIFKWSAAEEIFINTAKRGHIYDPLTFDTYHRGTDPLGGLDKVLLQLLGPRSQGRSRKPEQQQGQEKYQRQGSIVI